MAATRSSSGAGNGNSEDGEDLSELHLYRREEVILRGVELLDIKKNIIKCCVRLSV
jgi:hypothetical protein